MANEDARKLFVAGLPDSITEDVLRAAVRGDRRHGLGDQPPEGSGDRAAARFRVRDALHLGRSASGARLARRLDPSGQIDFGAAVPGRAAEARAGRWAPVRRGPAAWVAASAVRAGAPDRTLYVGNLPYDVTQQEVETLIIGTNAGPVARVHLPTDPDGRKRGFGFVTMGTAEGAKGAIEALARRRSPRPPPRRQPRAPEGRAPAA